MLCKKALVALANRNVYAGAIRTITVTAVCQKKSMRPRWTTGYLKDMWNRRELQGPEPARHRSEKINWNYDAELFAFGKRLGEEFNEDTLRVAFTERSYIAKEEDRRTILGLEADTVEIKTNEELIKNGTTVIEKYVKAYLRHSLSSFPEEGICAICDYLTSEEMLSYIGRHLGINDLLLTEEFPPSDATTSKAFKAVVGALEKDSGEERAAKLIQDFVITQLIGKDINEMWKMVNPMGVLNQIYQGRGEIEPRLLWGAGSETVEAAYIVGIYCNKELIGKAPGETVSIAEEMAARDSLKRLFGTTDNRSPFRFGKEAEHLKIDTEKLNKSLEDFTLRQMLQ